jgi:hypothetical protein
MSPVQRKCLLDLLHSFLDWFWNNKKPQNWNLVLTSKIPVLRLFSAPILVRIWLLHKVIHSQSAWRTSPPALCSVL